MNTKSRAAAAAVIGARHLRMARNGQDAAARWVGEQGAAVVVCDGCGSADSSEVGARLGARLVIDAIARHVTAGLALEELWSAVRADVTRNLARIVATLAGGQEDVRKREVADVTEGLHDHRIAGGQEDVRKREVGYATRGQEDVRKREVGYAAGGQEDVRKREVADVAEGLHDHRIHDHRIVRDYFLFTVVAAVVTRDRASVWAIGDGAYAIGASSHVLDAGERNQPPYLAYDLLGEWNAARVEIVDRAPIVIATDGASELELARFADRRFVEHPDALRRELLLLARNDERIDWDDRRLVRTPAVLQDDCAIGVLL